MIAQSGPLSVLSRAQYAALAAMRWSMFRNGLRSSQGAVEFGARSVAYVIYSLMGVGLAFGLGAGTYAIAANNGWPILPVVIWVVFIVWQLVPVSLASFQEQFDIGGLLRFPVGFGAFYLLHLIFGLIDISTILGSFCCLGVWVGLTVARPGLFAWAALALVVFAVFNIFMVRAIFAWIDRWLAQRRTREIVSGLFLVALLSLQLLNPAVRGRRHGEMSSVSRVETTRWLNTLNSVQQWLPPGLTARAVTQAEGHNYAYASESLALLGVFTLAAGAVLGARLRAEYRGENLGDAPPRKIVERRKVGWLLDGSGPMAAVIEKELRTLLRSLPLLYGLGAPLLMVFVLSSLYRSSGASHGHPVPLALLISLAYAMVGFTQLFYNNLGAEGPAVQVLFLSPTPIHTVLLAKNLFHGTLFMIDAVLVCLLASLRLGPPTIATLAATAAWLLFALPVHLAAGNAFSLTMPYRINLSRLSRQRGSQASTLLSMLIQLGVLGVGAAAIGLCSLFGRLWLAVPILLAMGAIAATIWARALRNSDAMANRHRDALIAALVKTE